MEYTEELLEKIARLEIFSDFDPADCTHREILKKVAAILEEQHFSTGDAIITEGEEGDSLYILYEGTVQVKRKTPRNEQFAVVNLSADQNVFFGEVALVDRDTRSASVIALSDGKVLHLDGKAFKTLCDAEPVLGYNVMYRIARRIAASLRHSNKDLMTLYTALLNEVEGGE